MYRHCFKRLTDIAGALCALFILSPVIIIITVALCFTCKGNVFFIQDRPGRNGKIFRIVKFKTMTDARDGNGYLLPERERMTKIGRFIRKTSLDEIPQLWNVLKGDMSLTGPRPLLVDYLPLYDDTQIRRHEVRPGITGLAQVNGRNAISWQQKLQWDVRYVDRLSFRLDIKIICKTILQVLRCKDVDTDAATDFEAAEETLRGKVILVTGAAGSVGSEIARRLCRVNPALLLLCDMAETPLYLLEMDLRNAFPDVKFQTLIADIRNGERMKHVFSAHKPHYVYHAAAYKHVPMMERHPDEAVLTNVMGTKIAADMAVAYGAECFTMISSDKAVNPGSVMGASKRIAEIYIQALSGRMQKESGKHSLPVRFIITRFGNVLGSSGSVVPIFEQQIREGGPVTVTDPRIIRYFMTIPEAVGLTLEASRIGKGGEIFVFDMGEPVKIKDIAETMIRSSGKDIDILYTGLRPGEKLVEELLYNGETGKPAGNRKIRIACVNGQDMQTILPLLNRLIEIARTGNNREVVRMMKEIVPEFKSLNSEYSELDM